MSWRKWLVRLLVFGVLGGAAFAVALYQRWTDPAAVRQQVIAKLQDLFPGATVSLESARLHLFGGIALKELRLVRRDDPALTDFLYVPSAVVYHDKEHLLDGKIGFRKVVLHHPRLLVRRGRDGHWNLEGLVAPTAAQDALPTVVIQQGTLLLDDRLAPAGTPPVEVTDVNLTLINDPLPTVSFEGAGVSEALGAVQFHGTWQRDSHAAALSVQADGLPLTTLLLRRLAACCPDKALTPFPLEGQADLKAELNYEPGSGTPLRHDIRCRVRQGKVSHPLLPLDLENVEAALRCVNGRLTVESLTATSGPARLALLKGVARVGGGEPDFDAVVSVQHLPLSAKLFDRLPAGMKWLAGYFNPEGPASVQAEWSRHGGRWLRHHYVIHPEDLRVCYQYFQYPAEHVTGTVEYDHLDNLTTVNVQGRAGGGPVALRGTWKGYGIDAAARLELTADDLRLDDKKLLDALPCTLPELARSFHLSGRCGGSAWFLRSPGAETCQATYHVRFADASAKWDEFRYPVQKISGFLDVYPTYWEFRDIRGRHGGGEITVSGKTYPAATKDGEGRVELKLGGRDIPLDGDLKEALATRPALARAWELLAPAGKLNFTAKIDHALVGAATPGQAPGAGRADDMDVTLDVHGCSVTPAFFPLLLQDLSGQFRYWKDQVLLTKVAARHGETRLALEKGVVDLYANGGFYADLSDLRGNPVVPDAELLAALPEGLRSAVKGVALRDPFAFRTRLVVAQSGDVGSLPDVYWDGQLWVRDAKLQVGVDLDNVTGTLACVGRHNGWRLLGLGGNALFDRATVLKQPFHDVHAKLLVEDARPDVLTVGLFAPVHGGNISGQARVEFHSDVRYELNLTASEWRLDDFGKHNLGEKSQLTGVAGGRLHLTGQDSGVDTLEGNGSIDVPYTALTKMYNLPLLLDLLKFLGLRWPDRTLFDEAHAQFGIHGNRVSIARLDLLGNVVSLWGRGEVNLDGTDIHLDFYPSWARFEQILPQLIRPIPPAISKQLLKIEVRGKVTGEPKDVEFHKKPMPVLVEPLLQVRDLVSGKKNGGN